MASMFGRSIIVPLTNKSGGGVVLGDVVVVDTTTDESFTTTTSAANTSAIGVAAETIASNAVGRVIVGGYASLVNVNASVTRNQFGTTHTVAKQATGTASRTAGTFCRWLKSSATPSAYIYPVDLAGAALTNPMTTAGDIIYSSDGSGTPARLAKGPAGANLSSYNGVVGWNGGTSFPASPATGDRYWRSDLGREYLYDGTRWLTTVQYDDPLTAGISALLPASSTGTLLRGGIPRAGTTAIYLEEVWMSFFVAGGASALSASHKWVITVLHSPAGTTRATLNIDSGSSGVWRVLSSTGINVAIATTEFEWEAVATKTGTPGNLYYFPRIVYRLIAT